MIRPDERAHGAVPSLGPVAAHEAMLVEVFPALHNAQKPLPAQRGIDCASTPARRGSNPHKFRGADRLYKVQLLLFKMTSTVTSDQAIEFPDINPQICIRLKRDGSVIDQQPLRSNGFLQAIQNI